MSKCIQWLGTALRHAQRAFQNSEIKDSGVVIRPWTPSPMLCALPCNCKKTLQTLPYETSSRPDDEVVVRGIPLPSLRRIVTKLLSSNKLQHKCIQCNEVTLFLHWGTLTSVSWPRFKLHPAESKICDTLSTGNRPVYNTVSVFWVFELTSSVVWWSGNKFGITFC